jgi:hypothetical protein
MKAATSITALAVLLLAAGCGQQEAAQEPTSETVAMDPNMDHGPAGMGQTAQLEPVNDSGIAGEATVTEQHASGAHPSGHLCGDRDGRAAAAADHDGCNRHRDDDHLGRDRGDNARRRPAHNRLSRRGWRSRDLCPDPRSHDVIADRSVAGDFPHGFGDFVGFG